MKIKNLLIDFSYGIIRKIQVSGKYKVAKVVNPDKCTRCTRCENACPFPFNAIKVDVNNGISINSERCIGCVTARKCARNRLLKYFLKNHEKRFAMVIALKTRFNENHGFIKNLNILNQVFIKFEHSKYNF